MANIVICADGTWNRPEEDLEKDHPTNVLTLARAIQPRYPGGKQHVFYDWGIGSYYNRLAGGITGQGIHKNILDCYRYIVQNYAPGDCLYLFGFSRGAYTVRALSGLIYNCGIVTRPDARLIEQAWRIYKSPGDRNHPKGRDARQFRRDHSHRSRRIRFVGVWDTVGALGIPFSVLGLLDPHDEFYDTKMGPNIDYARHALAIDELRKDFEPTLWTPNRGVDLEQVWFAGVHADIGGSYGPDPDTGNRVSDLTLRWMLDEAGQRGLRLEPHIREGLSDGLDASLNKSRNHIYRVRKILRRELVVRDRPTRIHASVRRRYEADPSYRPPRLRALVEARGWDSLDLSNWPE